MKYWERKNMQTTITATKIHLCSWLCNFSLTSGCCCARKYCDFHPQIQDRWSVCPTALNLRGPNDLLLCCPYTGSYLLRSVLCFLSCLLFFIFFNFTEIWLTQPCISLRFTTYWPLVHILQSDCCSKFN